MAVCGFICSLVIPDFRAIFEGFGTELPKITEMVLALSSVEDMVHYWPMTLFLFWASVLAVWFLSKLVLGAAGVQRLIYQIPLMGRVFKQSALAEFSQLLALMIEARMPLSEALKLVGLENFQNAYPRELSGGMKMRSLDDPRVVTPLVAPLTIERN